MDDQDQWWMACIHRQVEIIRRPKNEILYNYRVQADMDGYIAISCDFLREQRSTKYFLAASIYSDLQNDVNGGLTKGKQVLKTSVEISSCQFHLDGIVPKEDLSLWSTEDPYL